MAIIFMKAETVLISKHCRVLLIPSNEIFCDVTGDICCGVSVNLSRVLLVLLQVNNFSTTNVNTAGIIFALDLAKNTDLPLLTL